MNIGRHFFCAKFMDRPKTFLSMSYHLSNGAFCVTTGSARLRPFIMHFLRESHVGIYKNRAAVTR